MSYTPGTDAEKQPARTSFAPCLFQTLAILTVLLLAGPPTARTEILILAFLVLALTVKMHLGLLTFRILGLPILALPLMISAEQVHCVAAPGLQVEVTFFLLTVARNFFTGPGVAGAVDVGAVVALDGVGVGTGVAEALGVTDGLGAGSDLAVNLSRVTTGSCQGGHEFTQSAWYTTTELK